MLAIPVIPGSLYRIHSRGIELLVIAPHGCDAIRIGLNLLHKHIN